jgi:hypothetical protein
MNGSLILPTAKVEMAVATNDDLRYYLTLPYLDLREPEDPQLVATNGHMLIAAPVTITGKLESTWIPVEAIAAARKQQPAELRFASGMCGTKLAMFAAPTWTGDAKYPEWRRLLKTAPEGETDVMLQGRYLDKLAMALGDDKYTGLKLCFSKKDGKIVQNDAVRVNSLDCEATTLLMTMRL